MSESTAAPDADAGENGSGTEGEGRPPETGADADSEPSPKSITRKPASLSGVLSIASGAFVVLIGVVYSPIALAPGGLGAVALGLAFVFGDRRLADFGGLALLGATAMVGLSGSEPATLLAAVGTVLAWDLSNNAIGLGEQLGREAETTRQELLHAAGTLGVGLITAGASFVIFQSASGGQPLAAVFFLLLAMVALISSLRL